MRLSFLLPLFATLLLAALPARANPKLNAEERALLAVLHPDTPGRFLVKLETVALDERHKAVLLLTSEGSPEEDRYQDMTLKAEFAVVSGAGKSLKVHARESVEAPSSSGSPETSVSTHVIGKKGETVIEVKFGRYSDGEGSKVELTFFQFKAGTAEEDEVLERIMQTRYTPSSGSGYPHETEDVSLDEHPSAHEGYSDLSLTVRSDYCPSDDEDCRKEKRVERVCWTGTHYTDHSDCLVWKVTTSSSLKSSKASAYGPDNVRDGEDSTAWCEGAKGTGRGEWLKFDFHTPVTVQELTLVAGYNKSPEVWRNNARLKRVRLHFPDGTRQDADLNDTASPQVISLGTESPFNSVKLEVLAVYPGRRHADACVSEVDFTGVQAASDVQE
ncbi:discoidin domain-containing protein [Pyxidicoccus sp. 3LFB2]